MVKIVLLGILGISMANANQRIEVQGHRGARGLRPENTLSAFKYALENNIEVLEFDLSYTKDHKLILSHDEKINPKICLDPEGNPVTTDIFVHELTLAEAQKYDCGSLINPRFLNQIPSPKEKMPSFEEALIYINSLDKARKTKLNVEIKVHNEYIKKNSSRMVKELIAALKKHKFYDRSNIQSFDIGIVNEARKQDSKIKTAYLVEDKIDDVLSALNLKSTSDLVKKYKFNIFSPDFKTINKFIVKDFQSQGIQVIPWTVNEPDHWKMVIEMGVDGIITDYPVGLKDYLNKKIN